MSSNKSAVNSVIFYLCATSTTAILLVTFGASAASAANVQLSHQRIVSARNGIANNDVTIVTANDNNSTSTNGATRSSSSSSSSSSDSGKLNASHVNNTNPNVIVLPSSDNGITHSIDGHSDQHAAGEVENLERHLHLNEYDIVATTPTILTTKSPNRYRIT